MNRFRNRLKIKRIYLCFVILSVIIQSCSDCSNHVSGRDENDGPSAKDTAMVNQLIRKATNNDLENPDTILKLLATIEELSAKSKYERGSANALFQRGNLLFQENKYVDALSCFSKALSLAEKLNLPKLQADCLERMGSVHLATDDTHLALKLYYESMSVCEKNNYQDGLARAYNIIGVYKADCDKFDTAEAYLNKALEINKKINNTTGIIHNKGNLGRLYERKGDYGKAEKLYNEMVNYLLKIKDTRSLPVTYYNISSLYQTKKDLPMALKYMKLAIALSEQTHDTSLLSTLYGNNGEMLLSQGKYDSARMYLRKSVQCARSIDDAETEIQALGLMANLDSVAGNLGAAYRTVQRIALLKDIVCERKLKNNQKESELKYENSKKQYLIEVQQKELSSGKKELLLYVILLITSMAAGAFLIGLVVVRMRQHRKDIILHDQEIRIRNLEVERLQTNEEISKLKIEKIEEEMRNKDSELVSIALRIDHKNELLESIITRLKQLSVDKKSLNPESLLKEITASVKLKMHESDDSDLFNERFSSIHQQFFTVLKEKHPELSKNELKFCAYLRIHLSTDQIAPILNVTNEAIRKTRYRIRKKLGLSPQDSLEDYLMKF